MALSWRARLNGVLLVIIAGWIFVGQPQSTTAFAAQGAPVASLAAAARAKFTAKKYDEAVDLYRRYLRKAPRDYNAWNQLGAAYFHTGQPKKALRYLKHVERKTIDKSYNYYYQGLCYDAAEEHDKAKEYFGFAAQRFQDEYGSRANFEMAAIEYKARNAKRAQFWLNLYLQRYPTGVYRAQVQRMLASFAQGKWLDDVEGIEKPDMEKALFKYNKLSLSDFPHYWYLQTGVEVEDVSGQQPASAQGGLQPRSSVDQSLLVNSGVGLGPWHDGPMSAFGGYTYRQRWITDSDRFSEWTEDYADFQYFPLRADLLERRHQFYGDFRRDFGKTFYAGFFLRWEFARIGSTFFPSPDDSELRKVLKISDTMLFIPWIGASFVDNMRTLVYWYMRKEIDDDSPDYSNKTYELGLSGGGKPTISLGLSHEMEFPDIPLSVDIEAFRYEFIYNDYWLDYTRTGFIVSAEHELISRWFVDAALGYYSDSYILPRIKQNSCSGQTTLPGGVATPTPTDTTDPTEPPVTSCPRDDTGLLYQIGVYWNYTQFQRIALDLQVVQNQNSTMKEFEESRQTIQATFTMAFPSVKRVLRFVDRYADTAFTKEVE